MPRIKTTAPDVSREKNQRSLDMPYFNRLFPYWGAPDWLNGEAWRNVVARQPLAVACRETLIANIISLDWKIEPIDSTQRDEHKSDIRYYEKFLENTGEYDYTEYLDWLIADLLDIPFGGAMEVIREGDEPQGRVLSIIPIDGTTLFPTNNKDWPVGQRIKEDSNKVVYFPDHAINRSYYSPRRELRREGWGFAPPEKIYLALELLNRGDLYYANLLLDTPASGILDLGDMAKDSAEEWVKAWRDMLGGIDPFKIPVLYEHEKTVEWIPFTKNPADLMFDKAIGRYGSLVTAGYGMTISDIGISAGTSGGETLAGTIRQERQTRRTGFARLKKKLKFWFDRLLPNTLEFKFIDLDDELNVALGRARLASSTAWQQMVSTGMFTAEEGRQQMIADGLITISVPEKLPEEARKVAENAINNTGKVPERPTMLGRPVAPSGGGHGEVKAEFMLSPIEKMKELDDSVLMRNVYRNFTFIRAEVEMVSDAVGLDMLDAWDVWYEQVLDGKIEQIPEITYATITNLRFDVTDFVDFKTIVNPEEIKSFFVDEYTRDMIAKTRADFIRGEKSDLVPATQDITLKVGQVSYDFAKEFASYLNDAVKKGIISGTRRFILDNPAVREPDQLFETNVVSYVKSALDNHINKTLRVFANKISDIINKMIEGEYKDEQN